MVQAARMRRRPFLLLSALLPAVAAAQAPAPLAVLADVGLQDGFRALEPLWRAQGGRPLRLVFGQSPALARQAEQNATCDLLVLSDPARMEELAARRLVRPETRRVALGNALVLVTPDAQPLPRRLPMVLELPDLLGAANTPAGRLAVPDPALSATGRQVQQALAQMEVAAALQPRLLRQHDGRGVARAVARGEAGLGLMAATEAQGSPGIRVAAVLPAESHPPMASAFALCRRADPAAADLLAFLLSADALAVWTRLGFGER